MKYCREFGKLPVYHPDAAMQSPGDVAKQDQSSLSFRDAILNGKRDVICAHSVVNQRRLTCNLLELTRQDNRFFSGTGDVC